MKRLFLSAVICILFLSGGCAGINLNVKDTEKRAEEKMKLIKILDEISYPRSFEENVFDCSNQTALLYDFLTQKGYKCTIIAGWTFLSFFGFTTDGAHAWLAAEKNGEKFWVSPIGKTVVPFESYQKYWIRLYFYSLKEAKEHSKIMGWGFKEWEY